MITTKLDFNTLEISKLQYETNKIMSRKFAQELKYKSGQVLLKRCHLPKLKSCKSQKRAQYISIVYARDMLGAVSTNQIKRVLLSVSFLTRAKNAVCFDLDNNSIRYDKCRTDGVSFYYLMQTNREVCRFSILRKC